MLKALSTEIHPSKMMISYNIFIRFIKVGKSLHIIAFIGIGIFYIGVKNFIFEPISSFDLLNYFWLYLISLGFTLPIFAELDAYGRYQDYKLIKETIYKNGYDDRLIKIFMSSKCQRDSVLVAVDDLMYRNRTEDFFYNKGYRWYHILPDPFVKNPLVLFKKEFWYRILFTKKYQLKKFYW